MIAIRGAGSKIAQRLIALLPPNEEIAIIPRGGLVFANADRYFFCQGLLRSRAAAAQSTDEIAEGMAVNACQIIRACDALLAGNTRARICVMGSESGISGSYDGTYAIAKTRLHAYVEGKRLEHLGQQLVCVAPGIIGDAGMTTRRRDHENLARRLACHPKRRFIDADEVAKLVHFLLYQDRGYISGTVIRMHGGEAAWRA